VVVGGVAEELVEEAAVGEVDSVGFGSSAVEDAGFAGADQESGVGGGEIDDSYGFSVDVLGVQDEGVPEAVADRACFGGLAYPEGWQDGEQGV
jgi:hypothetical protein